MMGKVKENLPFWSEKLPEMPDLLYDSLQQIKRLPLQQQRNHTALLAEQKKTTQTTHLSVVGATFVLLAAILPVYDLSWYFPAFSGVIGATFWFLAWRKGC